MKYICFTFVILLFIVMTIVGLKECPKPEPVELEQFVLVDDIIFEVFMEKYYE